MSELVPKVFNKTKPVADAVTLFANNQVYHGWKDVSVSRQLNSVASSLQLSFTEKWSQNDEPWRLKPSDALHVHLGDTSVFRGYVDSLDVSFDSDTRTTKVSGRSKTGDLVDSSILTASEFTSALTIDVIAQKLLAPYGVSLVFRATPGDPLTFKTQQGETVSEALDRLARERELLLYPSFEGNLVMEKRGNTLAKTELVQGQNVFRASANFDNSGRFSEYVVKAQDTSLGGGSAAQNAQIKNSAKDLGITRYRPMLINAENPTSANGAQKRATYEANVRLAKAMNVNVEVQGWFQKDGTLWDVNQLVFCNLPYLGLRSKMLIKSVKYSKGSDGTRCNLDLINPQAFVFEQKDIPAEDDQTALLGRLRAQVKK